ncbi:hypothetical protein Hanom_Chr03g00190891 [Helianthus anomalus]
MPFLKESRIFKAISEDRKPHEKIIREFWTNAKLIGTKLHSVVQKKQKWLMYLRFLQILIHSQVSDLNKAADDIMELDHMTSATFERLIAYDGRKEFLVFRGLFGRPNNKDYAELEKGKWRHDNNDSDGEATKELKKMEKFTYSGSKRIKKEEVEGESSKPKRKRSRAKSYRC